MQRRDFIKQMGYAASALALTPAELFELRRFAGQEIDQAKALQQIEKLRGEPPARAEVRVERGGPRLFLNGAEIYPLFALSTHLYPTIENFRQAGLHIYHPIIGLRSGWLGPERYDWTAIDAFLGHLLELDPPAHFLPRLQLNTPSWWKEAHPAEVIKYGLKTPDDNFDIIKHHNLQRSEGGHYFLSGDELWEASFASEIWRRDTEAMLRAYARHIEASPLRSRVIGYMPTSGRTAEWNYFGANFLPDYSAPMQRVCGEIPAAEARINTTFGLLRDPQQERAVIEFYQKFHNLVADTALLMCRAIKQETQDRALVGVFYGYLLEQVRIQDGGYLATRKFLESPDVDYIAGPYTYQPGNFENEQGVRISMRDDAGNVLGNARGAGGDGGFRMMTESLRRHGKLYFSEMDPSTYLDANPHKVIGGHGGLGSDTLVGSQRILQRDLGQVFASGVGGWLFDFGPLNQAPNGWYASPPIIEEIKRLVELGEKRLQLDISPVAEIAAVCDARSFAATEHWETERPWEHFGIRYSDFINHWFLNTQARAFHRLGAPMDFLFHFDLQKPDTEKYRLMFMVNTFFLTPEEAGRLKTLLRDSGTTVVWFYAPGFITPSKLDLQQMEALTGLQFRILKEPGPMMIRCDFEDGNETIQMQFGVNSKRQPRFVVTGGQDKTLGIWQDNNEAAFALKAHDGYTSVYVGSAPLPQRILRWLARRAGAALWSTEPDIVRATRGAAMITATSTGRRILTLPQPMAPAEGGAAKQKHDLEMEFGEVKIFTATT